MPPVMKHLQVTLFILTTYVVTAISAQAKPNIVFILVDDMGYADISCYDAPDVKTPRIDKLAKEGGRFTQFYATGPECTPSRTGLLTGRYPQRVGGMECAIGTGNVGRYDDAIALAEKQDLGLPKDEAVLAPTLKKGGYNTAIFGKWHLGYEPKFSPLDQGFDQFKGFLGGNVDYFRHNELSELDVLLDGRKPVEREGYMTHIITGDSIKFLKAQKKEKPFFLYVAYSTPHFPFQSPADAGEPPLPDDKWTVGTRKKYVEMLKDMDNSVGKLLDAIEEKGMTKDTIVVFASDHGAMKPGLNTPLRDYKSTLFEGGIRVPCIVRWPAKIKAGQTSDQVGTLMDLTKSFVRLSGVKRDEKAPKLDGMDILDHVVSKKGETARQLFWRSKRGDRTWTAMRDGDWKYVRKSEGDQTVHYLFNLEDDPSEEKSLIDEKEEQWQKMTKAVAKWEKQVKAPRP